MKKHYIVFGIIFGVLCLLAATAVGLGVIHVSDFIYAADYDILGIADYSGISKEVVVRNYKAVMDFLSPFSTAEFSLPDLSFSETGAIHFEDCRVVFRGFYIVGTVAAVLVALASVWAKRKLVDRRFLLVSSITTITLPVAILLIFALDFDKAFIIFHKIFFSNDYWYFDPRYDPIINLLPEEFFLHCAIIIVVFWLAASIIQFSIYKKQKNRLSADTEGKQ